MRWLLLFVLVGLSAGSLLYVAAAPPAAPEPVAAPAQPAAPTNPTDWPTFLNQTRDGVSVEKVEEGLKAIEFPGVASVQIIFNMLRQRPAEGLPLPGVMDRFGDCHPHQRGGNQRRVEPGQRHQFGDRRQAVAGVAQQVPGCGVEFELGGRLRPVAELRLQAHQADGIAR